MIHAVGPQDPRCELSWDTSLYVLSTITGITLRYFSRRAAPGVRLTSPCLRMLVRGWRKQLRRRRLDAVRTCGGLAVGVVEPEQMASCMGRLGSRRGGGLQTQGL